MAEETEKELKVKALRAKTRALKVKIEGQKDDVDCSTPKARKDALRSLKEEKADLDREIRSLTSKPKQKKSCLVEEDYQKIAYFLVLALEERGFFIAMDDPDMPKPKSGKNPGVFKRTNTKVAGHTSQGIFKRGKSAVKKAPVKKNVVKKSPVKKTSGKPSIFKRNRDKKKK